MKRFLAATVASLNVQLSCAAVVAVNPDADEKTRAFLDAYGSDVEQCQCARADPLRRGSARRRAVDDCGL